MKWDPDRYERFQEERMRPGADLIDLVTIRPGLDVVDLGCGTGRLTRALADRLPESKVVGIDRSVEMLSRAAQHVGPDVRLQEGDFADLTGEWDVIWSNAALQWHPDHHALIPALFRRLRPGGQIAFQVPSNKDHPVTLIRNEVLARFDHGGRFDDVPSSGGTLPLHAYAEIMHGLGAEQIEVGQVVYLHEMRDAETIVQWQSGTALIPYTDLMDENETTRFRTELIEATRERYPGSPVPFAFQRTFCSAHAPAAPN